MECKGRRFLSHRPGRPVLIETLWNVKLLKGVIEPVIGEVLIETLWNVKDGYSCREILGYVSY